MIPKATDIVCRYSMDKCIWHMVAGSNRDMSNSEAVYVIYNYFTLQKV